MNKGIRVLLLSLVIGSIYPAPVSAAGITEPPTAIEDPTTIGNPEIVVDSTATSVKLNELFADVELSKVIAEQLNVNVDETISSTLLSQIITLDAQNRNITSLSGIENLDNVENLILIHNNIFDVTPLLGLTNLKNVNIAENKIKDISPIVNGEFLKKLDQFDASGQVIELEMVKDTNVTTITNDINGFSGQLVNPTNITGNNSIDNNTITFKDIYQEQRVGYGFEDNMAINNGKQVIYSGFVSKLVVPSYVAPTGPVGRAAPISNNKLAYTIPNSNGSVSNYGFTGIFVRGISTKDDRTTGSLVTLRYDHGQNGTTPQYKLFVDGVTVDVGSLVATDEYTSVSIYGTQAITRTANITSGSTTMLVSLTLYPTTTGTVVFDYNVTNTGSNAANIGARQHIDTNLHVNGVGNDTVNLYTIGGNKGIYAAVSSWRFNFYTTGIYGITSGASNFWGGDLGSLSSQLSTPNATGQEVGNYAAGTTVSSGVDSSLALKWTPKSVPAGESISFQSAIGTSLSNAAPILTTKLSTMSIKKGQSMLVEGTWKDTDSNNLAFLAYEFGGTQNFIQQNIANPVKGTAYPYSVNIPFPEGAKIGDVIPLTIYAIDENDASATKVVYVTVVIATTIDPISNGATQLTGTSEPGAVVSILMPNNETVTAIADASGNYTIDVPVGVVLTPGTALIVKSNADGVNGPEVPVIVDGTNKPVINPVGTNATSVSGTATPGTEVTVVFPDGKTVKAITNASGVYTVATPGGTLIPSGSTITATASDGSNISTPTNVIANGNLKPTIDPVQSTTTIITGFATPNTTVEVVIDGVVIGTTVVTSDGSYSVDIPNGTPLTSGTQVTARTFDGVNYSSEAKAIVDGTAKPYIAPILSGDTTVQGTATPNSVVKVGFPGGKVVEVTTDANGNYTAAVPNGTTLSSGDLVTAVATDGAGNDSVPTGAIVDSTVRPTIDTVAAGATQITGKSAPGTVVTVTFPDGTEVAATADATGNYVINVPVGVTISSSDKITAVATDGTNTSNPTHVIVDGSATPVINPITNDAKTVTGTATPGSTVDVLFPNGSVVSAVVKNDGTFNVNVPNGVTLTSGDVISSAATDGVNVSPLVNTIVDGNVTPTVDPIVSTATSVTGTAAPGVTVTVTMPDGTEYSAVADQNGMYEIDITNYNGLVSGEKISVVSSDGSGNNSTPAVAVVDGNKAATVNPVLKSDTTITGTATPNANVEVTLPNGEVIKSVADSNGNYSIDIPNNVVLDSGDKIVVTTNDGSGNNSTPITTIVDSTLSPSLNPINPGDTRISGVGTSGSIITVTYPDGTTNSTVVDANGNYMITNPNGVSFGLGDTVSVISSDENGNNSQPTKAVVGGNLTPVVNPINPGDNLISGIGTPGAIIEVKDASGLVVGTSTVNPDGTYSVSIPPQLSGDKISVVQSDGAGNSSQPTDIVVGATQNAPTVNPVNPGDTKVTGTGVPGANIVITDANGNVIGQSVVDGNGNYAVTIPAGQSGDAINITQNDGQNVSPSARVVIGGTTQPKVDTITAGATQLTGTGTPGTTVIATLPDGTTKTAVVGEDGGYVIDITGSIILANGDIITVVSDDGSGNLSAPVNAITGGSIAPVINPVLKADTAVTGTGTPGTVVTVTFPDGTTASSIVDQNGNYSVGIPNGVVLNSGDKLSVVSDDGAGNISTPSTTIIDSTIAPTLDSINPGDVMIKGTGTLGAIITVTYPDGTTNSSVVDANGNYMITNPNGVSFGLGDSVSVISSDENGNNSQPVTAVVGGNLAPMVNPVNPGDAMVTGTGTPGAIIDVKDETGQVIGSTTVNSDGTYSVSIPPQLSGDKISVIQSDGSGNNSQPTDVVVGASQNAPMVNPVNPGDNTVTGTGVPGANIVITDAKGVVIGQGIVDQNGNFTVTVPVGKSGDSIFVAQNDGNNASPSTKVVVGGTAIPVVDSISAGATQVTGTGTPGTTVIATLPDGTTKSAIVAADGKYSIDLSGTMMLANGDVVSVVSDDGSGNLSDSVSVITGGSIAPSINAISKGDTSVSGTGTPGTIVTVTFPDGTTTKSVVDENGIYSISIPNGVALNSGDKVSVVSDDVAGNVSTPTITIVDAAMNPTVDELFSNSTSVTGTGTPGAIITVTYPNGETSTAVVDASGIYEVQNPSGMTFKSGDKVTVTSSDANGNMSEPVETIVDSTVKPTVNPINPGDTTVSGMGTPGSMIEVLDANGNVIATTTVDANGIFTASIPSQNAGSKLQVVQTDGVNNRSNPIDIIVGTTQSSPIVNPVNPGDTVVTGKGMPGATIVIADAEGNIIGTSVVDAYGNYSVDIPTLKQGDQIFIAQNDGAGNITDWVKVIIGATLAPSVNPINEGDKYITGKGTPGATILVYDENGVVVGEAIVDENGDFSVYVANLDFTKKYTIVQVDEFGNKSSVVELDIVLAPVLSVVALPMTGQNVLEFLVAGASFILIGLIALARRFKFKK